MKRWGGWVMTATFVACAACGVSEPAGAPAAIAEQPAAATVDAWGPYRSNFGATPEGQCPPEFVDVRRDGYGYRWLYDGAWRVSRRGGEAVLEVPFALTDPVEPLSFRRYDGAAFGARGALPERYRVEAEGRSLGGSKRFNGYGELAIEAFYVSPTTYVEVLQTDKDMCVWEARNAPPMQGRGWKLLGKVAHPTAVGAWVRFGCEIDRRAGTIVPLLDGRPVGRFESALLKGRDTGRFTLRATGNREEWRWVTVTSSNPAPSTAPGATW